MSDWRKAAAAALEEGRPAVLVSVVQHQGSVPRGTGARMLVTAEACAGSIGGGELEYQAIGRGRQLLGGRAGDTQQIALERERGQICGGWVKLQFEPLTAAVLAAAEPQEEELAGEPQPLWLFGAGHVGRAIVRALAPLPFTITWIDGRAGIFPAERPETVTIVPCDPPWQAVARAPSAAFFLTMTHKHESDYAVCETVLRRGDAAYLGMIGSDAKRDRGLRWLSDKGLSASQIAHLTCPIGLPGIEGKEPAVIAAAVAADLLLRREARLLEMEGAA